MEYWLIEREYIKYKENIAAIFDNSTVDVNSTADHIECLSFEDEYTWLDSIMINMTEITMQIYDTKIYAVAYNSAKLLPALYRERLKYNASRFQEMYDYVNNICQWINYDGDEMWDKAQEAMTELTKVKDETKVALRYVSVINDHFSTLYKRITENIAPIVALTQYYLDANITKIDLADKFEDPLFKRVLETVAENNQELIDIARDYTLTMKKAGDKFRTFYRILLDLNLPVLNFGNVQELKLLQVARNLNDPLFEDLFDSMQDNLKDNVLLLVDEAFSRLIKPIEDVKPTFGNLIDDVLMQVGSLCEALNDYKVSTTMNTEFFM